MSRRTSPGLLACLLALMPLASAFAEPPPAGGEAAAPTDVNGDPLPAGAVARLGTFRLRHVLPGASGADRVAFSPDGKTLVSAGNSGVCVWDVTTGKERLRFRDQFRATSVHFAADGRTLLTGDDLGTIRHWDLVTGSVSTPAPVPQPGLSMGTASFFSADGRRFGAADYYLGVRVWDVAGGRQLNQVPRKEGVGVGNCYAALSPDGSVLVMSGGDGRARLIDAATGNDLRQIEAPGQGPEPPPGFPPLPGLYPLSWFTFAPDGRLLAAADRDAVCVWEVATAKLRYQIRGERGHVAFSPDGKYLACGLREPIRLYHAADGTEVRQFEPHAGSVEALAFSPDGKLLASTQGFTVSLWDVATGKRLQPLPGHERPVDCLAWSPDGTHLATGCAREGTLLVWDVASGRPRLALPGHYLGVQSVAFSPDGKLVATGDGFDGGGGSDGRIRLWALPEGRLLRDFHGHVNSVQSLAFSPDGRTLASAGHDARAKLWDVASGTRLHQVRGADSHRKQVALSPDGKALLVAGVYGELALWRVDSAEKVRDLGPAVGRQRDVRYAAFLPGGQEVLAVEAERMNDLSGNERVEARFWDVSTGRLLRSFPLPNPKPSSNLHWTCFNLSPDGKVLASAGGDLGDATVKLWDTASGKLLTRLEGHQGGQVLALAFSPDSKRLASGAPDTTVLIWAVGRARLEHLWAELAAGGDEALQARAKRVASPAELVPFLKERLHRAAAAEGRLDRLIADLDDDRFEVREKATRQLEELGAAAVPTLRRALRDTPGVEARRRMEQVLEGFDKPGAGAGRVDPRWVELSLAVLEEIDKAESRQALRELADGPADTTVTRAARAALERLAKRRQVP